MEWYRRRLFLVSLVTGAVLFPQFATAVCFVDPCSLSLNTAAGTNLPPQPLAITVTVTRTEVVTFTATVTTKSTYDGIQWLSVNPPNGYLGGPLMIPTVRPNATFNTAALPAGIYSADILIRVTGAGNPSQDIPVTLVVIGNGAATPSITQVTNAASNLPTTVAPGLILTIQGRGMAPDQISIARAEGGRTPTALAGLRVLVNEIEAPILYAESNQIGAVAPYEIAGAPVVSFQVEYQGVRSNSLVLPVAPSAPGLFTLDQSGTGHAAVLNQDLSVNRPENPADPESIVVLYLTGDGLEYPTPTDGLIAQTPPYAKPLLPVSVEVGGLLLPPQNIQYAGAAPLSIAGLMQINVKLPPGITGETLLRVKVGDAFSQRGVTVSVK
jgi:uncharacterized protein (TIGR03437 family)